MGTDPLSVRNTELHYELFLVQCICCPIHPSVSKQSELLYLSSENVAWCLYASNPRKGPLFDPWPIGAHTIFCFLPPLFNFPLPPTPTGAPGLGYLTPLHFFLPLFTYLHENFCKVKCRSWLPFLHLMFFSFLTSFFHICCFSSSLLSLSFCRGAKWSLLASLFLFSLWFYITHIVAPTAHRQRA